MTLAPHLPHPPTDPSGRALIPAPAPAVPLAPRVMLLSVWRCDQGIWHGRVVTADAVPHEFDSPFELVRFLDQLIRLRDSTGTPGRGLR